MDDALNAMMGGQSSAPPSAPQHAAPAPAAPGGGDMDDALNAMMGGQHSAAFPPAPSAPMGPAAPFMGPQQSQGGAPPEQQGQQLQFNNPPPPRGSVPITPANFSKHPLIKQMGNGFWGSYASATAAQQAMEEAKEDGIHVTLNSAGRTFAQQQALYKNRANNPNPVAPPGFSNHESGAAYDFSGDLDAFAPIAAKYGFARPLANDPVHFAYQPEVTGSERVWTNKQLAKFQPSQGLTPRQSLGQQASQLGYDPTTISVLDRQMQQESGYNPKAVSAAGAMGIPQMMPGTLAPYLNEYHMTAEQYTNNPTAQIRIGLEHMGKLLTGRGGDLAAALSDYNAGGGSTDAFKSGKIRPFAETTSYVAHILGTDPTTAAKWITQGGGPKVQPPNPDAQQNTTVNNFGSTLRNLLPLVNPLAAAPLIPMAIANMATGGSPLTTPAQLMDTYAQGMQLRQQDHPGYSAPGISARDGEEVARGMGRGFMMGLHEMNNMAAQTLDSMNNGLHNSGATNNFMGKALSNMLGAEAGVAHFTNDNLPWAKIAAALQPTGWNKTEQDYLNTMRNGKDFSDWAGAVWNGKASITDSRAWQANAGSLLMNETPELVGSMASMHLLQGGLMKYTPELYGAMGAPGAAIDKMLSSSSSPLASTIRKLGPAFFKDMATTQAVAATQIASTQMGDVLANGGSAQQAAKAALTGAVGGVIAGSLIHLGIPALAQSAGPAVEGAMQVAGAAGGMGDAASQVGNVLGPAIKEVHAALSQSGNPLAAHLGKTWTTIFSLLDGKSVNNPEGGLLTSRVLEGRQRQFNDYNEIGAVNAQKAAAQGMQQWGAKTNDLSTKVATWMNGVDQQLQAQQASLQKLQAVGDAWAKIPGNQALLDNENFTQAVKLEQLISSKQLAPDKPLPELKNKTPRQQLDATLKHLAPADVGQVKVFQQHAAAMDTAQSNLKALQARLPPELKAQLQADVQALNAVSSRANRAGEALANKTFDVNMGAIEEDMPGGMLPSSQAAHQRILDNMSLSFKQMVADGYGLVSNFPSQLEQAVTVATRSVLDNVSQIGNPTSRLSHIIDDLNQQRDILASQAPKPPEKPESGVNLSMKDGRYVSGDYSKAAAAYASEMNAYTAAKEQHTAELQALDAHTRTLTDSLEGDRDWIHSAPSVTDQIKKGFQSEHETELNQRLADAGVKGGVEQLNRLYNAPTNNAKKTFYDFWKGDPNAQKIVSGDATTPGRRITTADFPMAIRNEFDGAKQDDLKFMKVNVPTEWVATPDADPDKLAHLQGNAAIGEGRDQEEGIGRGSKVLRRPVLLSRPDADGKLSILDGNARVQRTADLGRSEIPAVVREDRWTEFLKSKLGDAHDIISGARGDLPSLADKTLWRVLGALGNPDAYAKSLEANLGPDWRDIQPTSTSSPTAATGYEGPGGMPTTSDISVARSGDRSSWWQDPDHPPVHVTGKGDVRDRTAPPDYFNASTGPAYGQPGAIPETSARLPEDAGTKQSIDFNTRVGPRQVSPSGLMNTDILNKAKLTYKNLSPEDMQAVVDSTWAKMADTFEMQASPSQVAYRNLCKLGDPLFSGDGSPPPMQELGLGNQLLGFMNQSARLDSDFRSLIDYAKPKTPGEALSQSLNAARDWDHKRDFSETIPSLMVHQLKPQFDSAMAAHGIEYENGKLPQEFGEKMADAIQSFIQEPQQMQSFLRQYPSFRNAFGGYFDLAKAAETFKISDPQLEHNFQQVNFQQIYPEMNQRMRQLSRDPDAMKMFTSLSSEKQKEFTSLAEARKFTSDAQSEVLSAPGWDKVTRAAGVSTENKLGIFFNMDSAARSALWAGDKTPKEIGSMLLGLSMRNPITDPLELMRIQLKSMFAASNNRTFLAHHTNMVVPGMNSLNPLTGREWTMLSHIPKGQEAPVFPSMKGSPLDTEAKAAQANLPQGATGAAPVPLSSGIMGYQRGDIVKIGGKDYKAEELFLHADAAKHFQDYHWDSPSAQSQSIAKFNEISRRAALAGGSLPHLLNINAQMTGAAQGYALQGVQRSYTALRGGDVAGVVDHLAGVPGDWLKGWLGGVTNDLSGQKLGSDLTLKVDSMLHGMNMHNFDDNVKGMARQSYDTYNQSSLNATPPAPPLTQVGTFASDLAQKQQAGVDWNAARDAHAMGGDVNVWQKLGIGLQAYEKWMCFNAVENAQLGAYAQWTATHWEDIGKKLVQEGVPADVAMRMTKSESAQMVNKLGGAPQSYVNPGSMRNQMYNSLLAAPLSPAWWSAKLHTIAAALPSTDMNTGVGGLASAMPTFARAATAVTDRMGTAGDVLQTAAHRADLGMTGEFNHLAQFPALAAYHQAQTRSSLGALLIGGAAGLATLKWLSNDPGDPSDPRSRWTWLTGNLRYPWPAFGALNTFMGMMGKNGGPLNPSVLLDTAVNQLTTFPKVMAHLYTNEDFNGKPIYSTQPGVSNWQVAGEMAAYALRQSLDIDPISGLFDPNKTTGQKVLGVGGIHGYTPNNSARDHAVLQQEQAAPSLRMHSALTQDLDVITKRSNGELMHSQDEIQQAKKRVMTQALQTGVQLSPAEQKIFPEFPDGKYRWTGDQLGKAITNRAAYWQNLPNLKGLRPAAQQQAVDLNRARSPQGPAVDDPFNHSWTQR
jgi:hypothetical protein